MKFGLYLPPCGEYADARRLADLAREAEEAGWEGFFIWDHMQMGWPTAVVDPWIALTAVAMNTRRIRFGPLVTPLPRRRPWKLARETASLDRLSGGRLTLGIGLGYGEQEFSNFGEPAGPQVRAAMLDEALEVLAGLWSGAPFAYRGVHYQIEEVQFTPTPVQAPRIPIWVAGFWPKKAPFRRAARWDGAFPLVENDAPMMTPQEIREVGAYIIDQRSHAEPFDLVHSGVTPGEDLRRAAEIAQPYAEAGVTWWLENINPWRFGYNPATGEGWPLEAMRQRIFQGPPQ